MSPLPNGHEAQPLRVLIVEDYPDAADSLRLILDLYGFEAQVARDGLAALQAARSFRPDVVLLDLGLPGMDGWEVARRLPAVATEKMPFLIAVTGFGREDDRRRSAQAGIDLHLVKPVDAEVLVGILKEVHRVSAAGPLATLTY
jgi:DNA-binding response OmpR family regulator